MIMGGEVVNKNEIMINLCWSFITLTKYDERSLILINLHNCLMLILIIIPIDFFFNQAHPSI